MTTFIVAPYLPGNQPKQQEPAEATSLRIDPDQYKRKLVESWPDITFYPPRHVLIQWGLLVSNEGARIFGALEEDYQTISLDVPFAAFFLWHRKIVPGRYRLFLFNDSSWRAFELTPDVTLEEIQTYIATS